uniref:7TM GPCR serpentine receptor class x (Srx) domain-containing protein n=1 Tax=Panagrolaimus sp. PS1159 TaxID=55785 RepID=A0AC35FJF7_9BILA
MSFLTIPLGIFLSFIGTCCVLFNFSMLITLWRGSFLSSKHGGIYLLAFAHIFGGMITASLVAFYLGPCIIAQDMLFETLNIPQIIGFIFHAQWFQDMLLQFVTSLNRIYLYYKVYTFSYLRTELNIADFAIDLPINISCSLIAIYVFVRASNNQISSSLNEREAADRKNRETKYALQFAACTGFCIFAWITFRVIPLLVPINLAEIFAIVTLLELAHCISNSLVFFLFNTEIRRKFFTVNSTVTSAVP